jgi:TonB-dependent SusC/RagA subfamily outer membrane receptor
MKTFITILFMISILFLSAQEKPTIGSKKITGVITDSEGMPIPGARVLIEGKSEGIFTDFDGNYTINAKEGEKLVVSYIGMFDETITINEQNSIEFKLRDDPSTDWSDRCYAPYIKKEITPILSKSTGGLNPEFIKMRPDTTGTVKDGCVGSESMTVIRCYGFINGSSEPLYVIDGVPLNADNFKAINPNDILSVSVLKDAGATSIYGNRGENGVIIVKTKNGLTRKEKRKQKREAKRLAREQTNKS